MEQSHFSIDDMQSYTPNEVTEVDGEQCTGRCISTDSFSMTVVPSGKLQHKVSYLVNSGGCKMCVDPFTQISHDFQFWDTWYILHPTIH